MKRIIKSLTEILKEGSFSKKEKKLIKEAYSFAQKKHKGQKFDGTKYDYFLHPAMAAYLLAKWNRNWEEVCAGLLHDTLEDCEVSLETIRRMFGERVAFLVDGMSWERKWNSKEKRYLKDRAGFYKKIMNYSKQDLGIVIVHCSDELSKLGDILKKFIRKKGERKTSQKKRYDWIAKVRIPFYRELG
jgi:GTP diphosphokinase / guanosine-3',5'-bis(diphosphate) 3'-diphosphatase